MDWGIVVIIGLFLIYYLLIFLDQRRLITEPKEIIMKFLAIVLFYAGVSLIYFSITGRPLLTDNQQNYNVYIFIIGFIAILWTIPFMMKDFKFYSKIFAKSDTTRELRLKSNHKKKKK